MLPPYCQKPDGCSRVSALNPNRCGGGYGATNYSEKCVEVDQTFCLGVGECSQPRARVAHGDMVRLVRAFFTETTNFGTLSSLDEVSDLYTHAVVLTPFGK